MGNVKRIITAVNQNVTERKQSQTIAMSGATALTMVSTAAAKPRSTSGSC